MLNVLSHSDVFCVKQEERRSKEESDAKKKADEEAKKKSALSSMGSTYSSHLQRVSTHTSTHTHAQIIYSGPSSIAWGNVPRPPAIPQSRDAKYGKKNRLFLAKPCMYVLQNVLCIFP